MSGIEGLEQEVEGAGAAALGALEGAGSAALTAGAAALTETVTEVGPAVVQAATPAIQAAIDHAGQAVAAHVGNDAMGSLVAQVLTVGLTAFLNHLLSAGHLPTLRQPAPPPPNAA